MVAQELSSAVRHLSAQGHRFIGILMNRDDKRWTELALNGVAAGGCDLRAGVPCTFALPSNSIRDGINALTLSIAGADRSDPAKSAIIFQGARIVRTPV